MKELLAVCFFELFISSHLCAKIFFVAYILADTHNVCPPACLLHAFFELWFIVLLLYYSLYDSALALGN